MNKKISLGQRRKTIVAAVPYAWRQFLAGLVVLVSCLSLFCSNAKALLTIDNTGNSDVYGLYASGDLSVDGSKFGYVITIANDNGAYSLLSNGGNITITGEFGSDGQIEATAGANGAAGLASFGSLTTSDIDGTIIATAGADYAFGLYADYDVNTGDIDGTIIATAWGSNAYGIYSNANITTGDIDGTITATAGDSNAAGLYASTGSLTTDDINGTITATATNGSNAWGLYGGVNLTTGAIDGNITATAGNDYAYGLYAVGPLTTGDIGGTITVDANVNNAYGLYSDPDITVGDITGTITVTAGDSNVYGLYSDANIFTGDINGTITAITGGSNAYGLYGDVNVTTGGINGTITADANVANAYGLYSGSDMTINGDIGSDANITAIAGDSNAAGLYSFGSLTTGNINGTIDANAGRDYAVGLYSGGSLTTGDINGTITATAGRNYAAGLCAEGDDSLTTGTIRGTITAHAVGDCAAGILSYGPMDVNIDGGTVSAIADGGIHAAAIQSGRIGSGLETQNANDTVTIAAGSTIHGDIDLGSRDDDDILTLSGVNTNSTTLDDDINNVENIYITGGTWHINGNIYNSTNPIDMSGGILSGTGTLGSLNVTGTLAPGGSIGTMTIDGDLTFGPAAVFEVDVTNASADKVIVTGTANLDGTIRIKALECIDHSFSVVVIDANGLTGNFSTLEGSQAFLIYSLSYDDVNNNVILNVEPIKIECDFNCDGEVDFEDLAVIAEQWLGPPGTPSADIAPPGGDGIVNFLDFAKLAEDWEQF